VSGNEKESRSTATATRGRLAIAWRNTMFRNPSFTALTTVAVVIILGFSAPTTAKKSDDSECYSPGYWKNHLDAWAPTGYSPDDLFLEAFEMGTGGPTLEWVLNLGGGHLNALARHSVAALLNAGHPDVGYCYDVEGVISIFQTGWDAHFSGDKDTVEYWKDILDDCNNAGCPG
jgi:hypothetical protein